jgi:hypothetical protein
LEAKNRIREYFKMGMPDKLIVARMERLGPPTDWILEEIKRVKAATRKPKRRITHRTR